MDVLFFHGLESGPHGEKYQALKKVFPDLVAPDFRGLRKAPERLALAEEATAGKTNCLVVGSSFGGLVAALLADKYPERIAGYVLCAPALHWEEATGISHVPSLAAIIHGSEDTVVPIEVSKAFALSYYIPLVTVEDGHRLQKSRDLIVEVAVQISASIA